MALNTSGNTPGAGTHGEVCESNGEVCRSNGAGDVGEANDTGRMNDANDAYKITMRARE